VPLNKTKKEEEKEKETPFGSSNTSLHHMSGSNDSMACITSVWCRGQRPYPPLLSAKVVQCSCQKGTVQKMVFAFLSLCSNRCWAI
jgi:hypothetical protein